VTCTCVSSLWQTDAGAVGRNVERTSLHIESKTRWPRSECAHRVPLVTARPFASSEPWLDHVQSQFVE